MIDIFNVEPVEVPVKPSAYSTFIYGVPKIGKTTLVHELFGDRVLILATEDRHKTLNGAKVIRITNWAEYLTVMGQLRQPKAKELYDVIAVDTVENLYNMLEKFIAAKWKEKTVGERQDIWGKDWADLKNSWKDGLNMIPNNGFVPCFVAHATENTVQIPAAGVLKSDLEGATVELKEVKDKESGQMLKVYEFQKYMPDLKDKVFAPINRMVDNILFCNTTLDVSTGEEQRVIYLRDTLQWMAGSTFKDITPIIPLNAKDYIKALEKAVKSIGTEKTTEKVHKEIKDDLDFDEIMAKVKSYGAAFHKAKKLEKINTISDTVFGLGNKMTEATEDQVELLAEALRLIEIKAEAEGIKIK